MDQNSHPFWSIAITDLLTSFRSTVTGLSSAEAKKRLIEYGANRLKPQKRSDAFTLLIGQFKSPIILILILASILSLLLHNIVDASIILTIVVISGILGFWQEHSASNAVGKLLAMVQITASAFRDGNEKEIAVEDIVPGDIVMLNAGDVVPGDCIILESKIFLLMKQCSQEKPFRLKRMFQYCLKIPLFQKEQMLSGWVHILSAEAQKH